MDVDPLADAPPPRHAIESDDDEDEYNPLPSVNPLPPSPPLTVNVKGTLPSSRGLVVFSSHVAATCLSDVQLGEQLGVVEVNDMHIGLIFQPKWTSAVVVVSEAFTRLPIWAMHSYAKAILDAAKPSSVVLLDVYSVGTYVSNKSYAQNALDAPIRYLSTGNPPLGTHIAPLSPPNLVHTTSASFLALSSTRSFPTTLLLLPCARWTPPPPPTLSHSNLVPREDEGGWTKQTVRAALGAAQTLLREEWGDWERRGELGIDLGRYVVAGRREMPDDGLYM